MKNRRIKTRPMVKVMLAGAIGAFFGVVLGDGNLPANFGTRIVVVPERYRIPKVPGETALRLAMVHDILHERYLRHGAAWYQKRNSEAEKIIAADANLRPPSERYLSAMDDLAVGLEQLGQMDQAIAVMRQKIQLLPPIPAAPARPTTLPADFDAERDDLNRILSTHLSAAQHQQYTACANLGTILLMASMQKAAAGNASAKDALHESLDWIERSIAINPYGHFGREIWQAIFIENFLAVIDHSDLLNRFDWIGDSLDSVVTRDSRGERFIYSLGEHNLSDSKVDVEQRLQVRRWLATVGFSSDWCNLVHPDYNQPMPFDEPTLAMIGMWTMGGGPNPHFALALGQIMEQIEQNSIAWNAYERATELSDTVWPDPAARKKFISYCNQRQMMIAIVESPNDLDGWQKRMRDQHRAELAWGVSYQNAYHDFESHQIAAGVAIDDPNFYTPFFTTHPDIASSPGSADDFLIKYTHSTPEAIACMSLGCGISMCLAMFWRDRKPGKTPG